MLWRSLGRLLWDADLGRPWLSIRGGVKMRGRVLDESFHLTASSQRSGLSVSEFCMLLPALPVPDQRGWLKMHEAGLAHTTSRERLCHVKHANGFNLLCLVLEWDKKELQLKCMFSHQQLPFEDKLQRTAADVVSLLSYAISMSMALFPFPSFLHLSSLHNLKSTSLSLVWPWLTNNGRQKNPSIYHWVNAPDALFKGQIKILC